MVISARRMPLHGFTPLYVLDTHRNNLVDPALLLRRNHRLFARSRADPYTPATLNYSYVVSYRSRGRSDIHRRPYLIAYLDNYSGHSDGDIAINTRSVCNGNQYTFPNSNEYRNGNCYSDCDIDTHAYGNRDSNVGSLLDADCDDDSHSDVGVNANVNAHVYPNRRANGYANTRAHEFPEPNVNAHANILTNCN
jgi:hypothetical protein